MITNAEYADTAQKFLNRAEIKGAEVNAFIAVMNWLEQQKVTPPEPTPDAKPKK